MEDKAALRRRLRRMPHASDGADVCARIAALPQWRQAKTVLAFYPMAAEPNLHGLLQRALDEGKTLLLPLTDAENRIHPCRVTDLAALRPGRYGILEPRAEDETAQEPDLILVPAVAYDERCMRLGHGAGCYDRYLPGRRGVRIGVCFDENLLPAVPCDAHDQPVDLVVTQTRTVYRTEDPNDG